MINGDTCDNENVQNYRYSGGSVVVYKCSRFDNVSGRIESTVIWRALLRLNSTNCKGGQNK